MASGSWYGLRLPHVRIRGADHLRSVKDGTENRRTKLLRAGRGLAWALLLLLILRALGQGLVVGVAGATLVLLLQGLVDPTLLFWSVPWEALHLVLSRRFRVNHLWLHRTQDLARESIGRSMKADGFAMADGFVLIGVGRNKQLVQWTADSAWRGMAREREPNSSSGDQSPINPVLIPTLVRCLAPRTKGHIRCWYRVWYPDGIWIPRARLR